MNQEIEEEIARLVQIRADRKKEERGYAVAGDLWWWKEQGPTMAWEFAGILCAIAPGATGFNGYTQLPKDHPWVTVDLQYDDDAPDIRINGGISFGPHLTRWIGFDTAHYHDLWPWPVLEQAMVDGLVDDKAWGRWAKMKKIEDAYPDEPVGGAISWTIPLLQAEVQSLAVQVRAAAPAVAMTKVTK